MRSDIYANPSFKKIVFKLKLTGQENTKVTKNTGRNKFEIIAHVINLFFGPS